MQPLDQGIIRAFKARYHAVRSLMLFEIHKGIRQTHPFGPLSESETAKLPLSVLQTIKCSVETWNSVTQKTIGNCWKTTCIIPGQRVDNIPENSVDESPLPDTDNEISPEVYELLEQCPCLAAELDQYDVGPLMCDEPDEQQLIREVREEFGTDENNNPVEDADEDVADSETPLVSAREIVGYLYMALNDARDGSHFY